MSEPKNGGANASTRAPRTADEVRAQLQTDLQLRTQKSENAGITGETASVRRVSENSR